MWVVLVHTDRVAVGNSVSSGSYKFEFKSEKAAREAAKFFRDQRDTTVFILKDE